MVYFLQCNQVHRLQTALQLKCMPRSIAKPLAHTCRVRTMPEQMKWFPYPPFMGTANHAWGGAGGVPDYHAALDTQATTRTKWWNGTASVLEIPRFPSRNAGGTGVFNDDPTQACIKRVLVSPPNIQPLFQANVSQHLDQQTNCSNPTESLM